MNKKSRYSFLSILLIIVLSASLPLSVFAQDKIPETNETSEGFVLYAADEPASEPELYAVEIEPEDETVLLPEEEVLSFEEAAVSEEDTAIYLPDEESAVPKKKEAALPANEEADVSSVKAAAASSFVSISDAAVTLSRTAYTFNGKAAKPSPTVKLGLDGKTVTLVNGTDYKVSYKNNINAGTAYAVITGIGSYTGTVKAKFTIAQRSLSKASVSGVKNMPYTGKAVKPSPTIKLTIGSSVVKLKKGTDYTLTFKNNRNVSTSSSLAQITIKGTGNYKGSVKKTFKIVKADPGLSFSKTSVTKKPTAGSFTLKASQTASDALTLTYSSGNKSVATVNSTSGKVTIKGVGSAKITVKSKASAHYKAGSASYTVKVSALSFNVMNHSFRNYATTVIPKSTFRIFFGSATTEWFKRQFNSSSGMLYAFELGQTGVCFGLCANSIIMNLSGTGLAVSDFSSSASRLNQLPPEAEYHKTGLTLKEIVEAMFLSQLYSSYQVTLQAHKKDLAGLVKTIRTGKPAIVSIFPSEGSGGHAVTGYKYEDVNSTTARIYVYDANHNTDGSRYITLTKNGSSYTGWSYSLTGSMVWGSKTGGWISFTSGDEYKSIWLNREGTSSPANVLTKLSVSSDNFVICSASGQTVASMKNGIFSSFDSSIFPAELSGIELGNHLIYLPAGTYTVKNEDSGEYEVAALAQDQGVTVITTASEVTLNVDDEAAINEAVISADRNDTFEVSLISDLACADGREEITLTGTGSGKAVTFGTEAGACFLENCSDASLAVNGEEVPCLIYDGEVVFE